MHVNSVVGVGYESQTSPLVRLSPEGTLVLIDGLARLAGSHVRVGIGGMVDHGLGQAWRLALGGDVQVKRSPSTRDLDFMTASTNAMLRRPSDAGIFGIGPSLQRIWVAGSRFRDATGVLADWTLGADDGSHWMASCDLSSNRHPGDYADFDSRSASAVLRRHVAKPIAQLDALDIEIAAMRESNRRRFAELSSWSGLIRAGVERNLWSVDWSAEVSLQRAWFDDAPLASLPARRDRGITFQFAADRKLSSALNLRVEFTASRNRANVPIYNYRYRQTTLALVSNW